MCFQHDLEQVGGVLAPQLKHLSHTTSEVLHGLRSAAALQGLVRSVQPANIQQYLFKFKTEAENSIFYATIDEEEADNQ